MLHLLLLLLFLLLPGGAVKLQGGNALALAGKGCAVLAMDQRVGTRCGALVVDETKMDRGRCEWGNSDLTDLVR